MEGKDFCAAEHRWSRNGAQVFGRFFPIEKRGAYGAKTNRNGPGGFVENPRKICDLVKIKSSPCATLDAHIYSDSDVIRGPKRD